jgi:hypothetical protein
VPNSNRPRWKASSTVTTFKARRDGLFHGHSPACPPGSLTPCYTIELNGMQLAQFDPRDTQAADQQDIVDRQPRLTVDAFLGFQSAGEKEAAQSEDEDVKEN